MLVAAVLMGALASPLTAQDPVVPPTGSATLLGQVVAGDSDQPVPSVSVEVLFASDSFAVGSAVADAQGRFRVRHLPEGTFFVRLSSIGYGTVTTETFEVAAAEERDLGPLALPVEAIEIDPLTVSTQRTAVTFEADRISYNVGVMPGTDGASVTEALATIPELEVGIDGQVTLREGSVSIYIDGRAAPMSGEALALFLEQFPADYLQEIQVVDSPSARWRAEGTGGVVNLVTKEGVELGLSGNVFAQAGTRGQYGMGGRGTLQRGDWTVNGGGFLRLSDSESTGYDLRQNLVVAPEYLRQDSWTDRSGLTGNVDLDLRWDATERSRLRLEGRVSGSGDESDGLTTTTHLEELDLPLLTYDRTRAADAGQLTWDLAANWEWENDEGGQELQVEAELQQGSEWENSREEILEEIERDGGGALIPAELTLDEEDQLEREFTVEVDWLQPLGEETELELGWELERTTNEVDRVLRLLDDPDGISGGEVDDRGHDDREVNQSAYATVQRSFGPVGVQVGARAEHTDLSFQLPDGTRFGQAWFDLFPSANVSWRMDDVRNLRLSYSRRVERPGLSVLNPLNTSTDPSNRRVGNPDIEPQYAHVMSAHLRWSLGEGSLRISPYLRATENGWAQITTVDDDGVSTRSYANLASTRRLGASVGYSLRPRDGIWGGYVSVSAAHEDRDASNLDARYSGSSFRVSTRANLDLRVTDQIRAQANLRYSPATDLPQGRVDARYRADFGARWQAMDDRMSLRLRLRDPFGLEGSSSRLRDLDYILIGRSDESSRSAELSVAWTLGGGGEMRRGGRGWR